VGVSVGLVVGAVVGSLQKKDEGRLQFCRLYQSFESSIEYCREHLHSHSPGGCLCGLSGHPGGGRRGRHGGCPSRCCMRLLC
jgi:hypothetical protein